MRSILLAQLLLLGAAALVAAVEAFVVCPMAAGRSGSCSRGRTLQAEVGSAQPPGPPPPPAKPLLRVLGPDGKELRVFEVKAGANLRKTLQAQKLDVYEFISKLTNCNGAGQCGTCAVKIESDSWGPRSEWEAGKLAKKYGANNEEYHLACQTLVQPGEATITLRPPPKK